MAYNCNVMAEKGRKRRDSVYNDYVNDSYVS